jgi:hypothetical protein
MGVDIGVVVHVVDANRPSDLERFKSLADIGKNDIVIALGPMCNGTTQAAMDIARQTKPGSIDQLIFYGHGTEAFQGIAMGSGEEPGGDGGLTGYREGSGIGPDQLGNDKTKSAHFKAYWQPLANRFSSKGVVTFKGCHTGGGKNGKEFLRRLAKIFQKPVQASDWAQSVGRSKLVGNIITAYPNGQITENEREGLYNLKQLPLSDWIVIQIFGRPRPSGSIPSSSSTPESSPAPTPAPAPTPKPVEIPRT